MHTHIEKRLPRTHARSIEARRVNPQILAETARRLARRARQQVRMSVGSFSA